MAYLSLDESVGGVHCPPARVQGIAHVKSLETYKEMYEESINEPVGLAAVFCFIKSAGEVLDQHCVQFLLA
jgi:hypothetical protein